MIDGRITDEAVVDDVIISNRSCDVRLVIFQNDYSSVLSEGTVSEERRLVSV